MYPVHASGCFSVCDRLAGIFLIRGNPLPQSVQTWIRKHPESTICGEVVRCRENEDFNLYILEILILFTILKKFPLII